MLCHLSCQEGAVGWIALLSVAVSSSFAIGTGDVMYALP